MKQFIWKHEYELGHLRLDKEHRKLFEIAQKALEVVEPDQRKLKIKTTMHELYDYTNTHFDREEHYMEAIGYPDLEKHRAIHKEILGNLNLFIQNASKMPLSEFEKGLATFIEKSLVNHIIIQDRKIHAWLEHQQKQKPMIEWKARYALGDPLTDEEHKHLFDIAQKAFEKDHQEQKSAKERVRIILKELLEYTKTHFAHEEELMRNIHYGNLEDHLLLHRNIEGEMQQFIQKLPSMGLILFEEELALFIEKWIVFHVVNDDRQIGEWIEDRKNLTSIDQL